MTETLQLKYLLNKYAEDIDKRSVIDVIRLTTPTELNKYTDFTDIYDTQTRDGLASSSDNSLIVTSVTTSTLRNQLLWSGNSIFSSFEKARFKESASGLAYGWGSREFTQETWGVSSAKHTSSYNNGIIFEQLFDNPKSISLFTEVASMFLPTLVGRTQDGGLYDILSDYTSKSQFTYNPITEPVYMKKRSVATFIGTDKDGTYKVAWQDISNNAIASTQSVAKAAGITGGITNTYISEYYTPTIVYDTNAFTTSNSPDLNRSDKNVSEAQYTLTLNLQGMDSVRGNSNYKFNRKTELVSLLKYAKGFWHNTDMIGLANYYLPFAMYLNQIDYVKVLGINVNNTQQSQSTKISDNFTYENTDPIKLVGVADTNGKLAGVKLSLDASALIADSSLTVEKPNVTTVSNISEAGVSRIKVNKSWVETVVENKIVDGPRLEYPIAGFGLEYDSSRLHQTSLVVYQSTVSGKLTWITEQQSREKGVKKIDITATKGTDIYGREPFSLLQTVWPDLAVSVVTDTNNPEEDSEESESSGESSGGQQHVQGIDQSNNQSNKWATVTVPRNWSLVSTQTVLVGGLRKLELFQGNERLYSTEKVEDLTKALAVHASTNIGKYVDFNLDNVLKINKGLVAVRQEINKFYTPNWGLSSYKTVPSKYGKVGSVMYNHNTVAITTENAQIKTLEKEPTGIALISQRPQVITSNITGYVLGTKGEIETERKIFVKANSSRTSGVETSTFGKVTLRTGQTGVGYVGRLLNQDTNKYELITEEIHNGASIELDKQNIFIDTVSNYDYLITDPNIIEKNTSIVVPKSSSKQNGAVYIKTCGFTSEIYDKYAESASAAIRFSSSAARLCEVHNNEENSKGIHNSNLGQIKQTTYERIRLSSTQNLSDDDSTVLENKVNITAGGYRYQPAQKSTGKVDRIVYKSCSLELTQDDVYVTIGKTVYSMSELFKLLSSEFGTKFEPVIVSKSRNLMTGNRPLTGYNSTSGLNSGVAIPGSEARSCEKETIYLLGAGTYTADPDSGILIGTWTPNIDGQRLGDITLGADNTLSLANNLQSSTWTTVKPEEKNIILATRELTLARNSKGILKVIKDCKFKISTSSI